MIYSYIQDETPQGLALAANTVAPQRRAVDSFLNFNRLEVGTARPLRNRMIAQVINSGH
jgi:hypothetical protein